MGRKDALGCIEKREILNQPAASTETLKYWGDWFFEKAHFSDAIDFYAKINDRPSLEKILQVAVEEGDLFLFNRVNRVMGAEPDVETVKKLAEQAKRLGKERFAAEALKQAGVEETDSAEK